MTEPPKDYVLTDKDWADLAAAYDDDYWPPQNRFEDINRGLSFLRGIVWASLAAFFLLAGFLVGVAI